MNSLIVNNVIVPKHLYNVTVSSVIIASIYLDLWVCLDPKAIRSFMWAGEAHYVVNTSDAADLRPNNYCSYSCNYMIGRGFPA